MKICVDKNFLTLFSSDLLGWHLFQIGLFLLPSSALLAGISLIIASLIATFQRSDSFFDDQWNYLFIIISVWMLIGCFNAYSGWLAWVGLANWIPLFWCFWAFQPYLRTSFLRQRSAYCLIAGSVPVLVTGFGQIWFGWEGPWQLFNGLIIWFIAPGGQPPGRLSGLFDYANIAAAWLVVIWPFALAALSKPSSNYFKRGLLFLLVVSICIALIMTDSRNGWGGLVFAIPFVLGASRWIWFLPIFLLFLLPICLAVLPGIDTGIQALARSIVPESIWTRLNGMKFVETRITADTRMPQWKFAIELLKNKPWFGWGAATFSVLYPMHKGLSHVIGHAHNLPLEVAVSHGFPVAILIVFIVLTFLILALVRGVLVIDPKSQDRSRNLIFDRAWWTSIFLLVCLHATDMPFFDSRINIVGWILLSGLRCLVFESKIDKEYI